MTTTLKTDWNETLVALLHSRAVDAPPTFLEMAEAIQRATMRQLADRIGSNPCHPHLIFLSGPSGAGKGTIVQTLLSQYGFSLLTRHTTRPLGPGETDGKQYLHITENKFQSMFSNGEFVGTPRNRYGQWRGLCRSNLHKALSGGRWVMEGSAKTPLDLLQDADSKISQATWISIFVLPPTFEELEKRLRSRNRETDGEEFIARLSMSIKHLKEALTVQHVDRPTVDAFIVNQTDQSEIAAQTIASLLS
ncbi:hypothetical protein KKF61_06740 [Patescibacteria group bacterium]|nr:hypothetical protein [Patescibacteria group bacterium]MBU0963547.1 hypothetical protein [Patescibacteria group bacterium]